MRKSVSLIAISLLLSACTTFTLPKIAYDEMKPAVQLSDTPPKAVQVVELPKPLPLPGQLKLLVEDPVKPDAANVHVRIARANKAARIEPKGADYLNAIQVYPYADGALYQVYAAPGEITDIALEPSEQLIGTSPVAAGDTVRWIIGDTESGSGAAKRGFPTTSVRIRHRNAVPHATIPAFQL